MNPHDKVVFPSSSRISDDDYVLYDYLAFGRFLFGLNGCISITYISISFAPFRPELARITSFLAGDERLHRHKSWASEIMFS